jgi:hypothetical protein
MRKFTPNRSADLSHFLGVAKAVEASHQRGV